LKNIADAWITYAVDKATFTAALDLGQSLQNVSAKKHSIVLVAGDLDEKFKWVIITVIKIKN